MKKLTLLLFLTLFIVFGTSTLASANHLPGADPAQWENRNIELTWAANFPDDQKRTLIRQILEKDPGCYAGTCNGNNTTGSWAHWYISDAYPHIQSETNGYPRSDYSRRDQNCTSQDNRAIFHWQALQNVDAKGVADKDGKFVVAGEMYRCPFNYTYTTCEDPLGPNPTSSNSAICQPPQVTVPRTYTFIAGAYVAFNSKLPDNVSWSYGGPGVMPGANQIDFQSVVAHEMGHVFDLGHYVVNTKGYSTELDCQQSPTDPDNGQDNSKRSTMCQPIHLGTKRQMTPEQDEKDTFRDAYMPKM